MKQGTTAVLPVKVNIDLDTVSYILFKMRQGKSNVIKKYKYPSDSVSDLGNGVLGIKITDAETFDFAVGDIELDTKIYLLNSDCNPQTPVVRFRMSDTLFVKGETASDYS